MKTPRWIRRPFAIVTIVALLIMAGLGVRAWIARRPAVIFVETFTSESADAEATALAARLTTATRVALGASGHYQVSATAVRADTTVRGRLRNESGSTVVHVSVEDGAGGHVLWSTLLSGDAGRLSFLVPQTIADAVDAQRSARRPK